MPLRLLSAAFLAACLALPAQAASLDVLKLAAPVARLCLDHMPDSEKVIAAFKAAGMRNEGRYGDYHLYSTSNLRIFAGGPGRVIRDKTPECIVVVDKMTPQQAEILMVPWVQATKAKRVAPPYPKDVGMAYVGTLRGREAVLIIYTDIDLYHARGAAILLSIGGKAK